MILIEYNYEDILTCFQYLLQMKKIVPLRRTVSSVAMVEHSSTNPKVPSSIPGLVSYPGHGL